LQKMLPHPDTYLVAWGDADRKVLGNLCEKYGLAYPFVWENYIDLAEEYKEYRSLDHLVSLKKAIEENAIEQIGILHSALDDAINAAQVMAKMLKEGWKVPKLEPTSSTQDTPMLKVAEGKPRKTGNIG